MKQTTYWEGNGKYQNISDQLRKLIPDEGRVLNPVKNRALEKFRKASNCYYDLYNNGLWNRAGEFRHIFGFGGVGIAKRNFPAQECAMVEEKMDEIILDASREQKISEEINK